MIKFFNINDKNMKKNILKIFYKINLVRKFIRSYFTNRHLSATLYGKLFFNKENQTWRSTHWMGTPIWKLPLDMWVYQEILFELKPDKIIECGTNRGGSALFLAHLCDLIGHGEIVTIDIESFPEQPKHLRIQYLLGSSISESILNQVKSLIKPGERVLVILDSNHRRSHVIKELEMYSGLVTLGSYLIVEDTYLNGYPIYCSFGPGPMEAAREFLKTHKEFIADKTREKFFVTWNPNGFLKRVK